MAEHDFRFSLLSPQHTLIECRALVPGRYQVTGNGGSIKHGDVLIVTLRGSKTLSMRLTVEGDALFHPPGGPVGRHGPGAEIRRAGNSHLEGQLRQLRQRAGV